MNAASLECVINVSEGARGEDIAAIADSAGSALLDLHSDAAHNRTVLTLAGFDTFEAARAVTRAAVERLELGSHTGVHPRLGVVDVVPFVPLEGGRVLANGDLRGALAARAEFISWAATALGLPCFSYGPERTLPEVRRRAFSGLAPDAGPNSADPRSGAVCVGARQALIAFNMLLESGTIDEAKAIARSLRSPEVRALGFAVNEGSQVSCNLIAPFRVGPGAVYDRVSELSKVSACELVGLIPAGVLAAENSTRWVQLGIGPDQTVEERLAARR